MGFLSKPSMPTFEIESQKDKFYGYPETYAFILILKTLREKVKEITCRVYKKSVLFLLCLLIRNTAILVSLTTPQ